VYLRADCSVEVMNRIFLFDNFLIYLSKSKREKVVRPVKVKDLPFFIFPANASKKELISNFIRDIIT
jgi:hypothetical protein